MPSRRTVLASLGALSTLAGCAALEQPGPLEVTIANQSERAITAELTLVRGEEAQLETTQEVPAGESWSSSELQTAEYFAVLFVESRNETLSYHYYPTECTDGTLTAMIRESEMEFLQKECY